MLVFSGFARCEHGDTHPNAPQVPLPPAAPPKVPDKQPNPHEGDPQPSGKRFVIIHTAVPEKGMQPWEVIIVAPGADRPYVDELVAGTEYFTRLLVPTDSTAQISVEVKPPRVGSEMGYCSIQSGRQKDGPRYIAKGWRAQCFLTLDPKQG